MSGGCKMRLLILALDGLDYDLVVKWRLKNLMQTCYGRHRTIVSPRYGEPLTPTIWASFLTGKRPEEHGVDGWYTYGRFLDKIRFMPIIRWVKGKRRLLSKLGLKPRIVDRRDLRTPTLLDIVKPSKALFVPAINEPTWIHREYEEALMRGLGNYIAKIWEIHGFRKRAFFKELGNGFWKLFMAWFDIADLLGHVCICKHRLELLKAYMDLDRLVVQAKKILGDDVILLIVSDHGIRPAEDGGGERSEHGFWSLSVEPPGWWHIDTILDFKENILKLISP